MGFWDFLFGGASGRSSRGIETNIGYEKLLSWAHKRIGGIFSKGMTDIEIENYISVIKTTTSKENKELSEEAVTALRDYIKKKYG